MTDRHKHDGPMLAISLLRRSVAVLSVCLLLVLGTTVAGAATPYEDVQRIGLQPLYEALIAVANCPDLTFDERRFRRVAESYHLAPEDLTPFGQFGPEIAELTQLYARRVNDDRGAFCSSARLSFAVIRGILRPTGLPALR